MALPLVAPPPRALEPAFVAACRTALAPVRVGVRVRIRVRVPVRVGVRVRVS
jgi:hypothetical protein